MTVLHLAPHRFCNLAASGCDLTDKATSETPADKLLTNQRDTGIKRAVCFSVKKAWVKFGGFLYCRKACAPVSP